MRSDGEDWLRHRAVARPPETYDADEIDREEEDLGAGEDQVDLVQRVKARELIDREIGRVQQAVQHRVEDVLRDLQDDDHRPAKKGEALPERGRRRRAKVV